MINDIYIHDHLCDGCALVNIGDTQIRLDRKQATELLIKLVKVHNINFQDIHKYEEQRRKKDGGTKKALREGG